MKNKLKEIYDTASTRTKLRAVNTVLGLTVAGLHLKKGNKKMAGLFAASAGLWARNTVVSYKFDKNGPK